MKVMVELFLATFREGHVEYIVRTIDISKEHRDPDIVARVYLEYMAADKQVTAAMDQSMLHSTSWRYERSSDILLTYLFFSEDITFRTVAPQSVNMATLQKVQSGTRLQPRPASIEPVDVLLHGLRHIAFLLQHDTSVATQTRFTRHTQGHFQTIGECLSGRFHHFAV